MITKIHTALSVWALEARLCRVVIRTHTCHKCHELETKDADAEATLWMRVIDTLAIFGNTLRSLASAPDYEAAVSIGAGAGALAARAPSTLSESSWEVLEQPELRTVRPRLARAQDFSTN